MSNPALLNNVSHQDVKVITRRAAELGDAVMYSTVLTFEFRNLQAYYPILLQQDAQGSFFPVSLFGFQEGENLFLKEPGWAANYIPAMMEREPFLIGYQGSEEDEKARMLSIDMDHPRVSLDEGEPLFQPLGGRTPFLESAANLLEAIFQGLDHTKLFIDALQAHDLIETINFEITLKNGSRNQLIGFHGIAEEKVQQLSGDVLGELNRNGFLMPLFMMIGSVPNLQRLIDFKNESI